MAQTVKHLSTMQETWVQSLGWEDPLEKEMATHSRTIGGPVVKNLSANAGAIGSIPGSARSPREGNGNPLQYSCLENPWTQEPGGQQSMGLQVSDMT